MKPTKSLLFASLILLAPSYAWTEEGNAAAEHATHHPAAMDNKMSAMQDHMLAMQDTMQKARAATSEAEREKLLAEHMTRMQEQMKMMKDMKGMGGGRLGRKDLRRAMPFFRG